MTQPVQLSVACETYDIVSELQEGRVAVEGAHLNWTRPRLEEAFVQMLRHGAFDASEMSLSLYMTHMDRKAAGVRAIPVFLIRRFRHSIIFVRVAAGITRPEDLVGRRVGVPDYQMTAALWARGLLHHEYGVAPESIHWVTGNMAGVRYEERIPIELPARLSVVNRSDVSLDDLLDAGEIDALISPRPPHGFFKATPTVRRLFPDYLEVEADYFRRTGIFPVMHIFVIREDVLDRYPWLAQNFVDAFSAARDVWYRTLQHEVPRYHAFPWLSVPIERTIELMGRDFWPYGLERNRVTLEAATQYSHEQGLTSRRLSIEELFVPGTIQPPRA